MRQRRPRGGGARLEIGEHRLGPRAGTGRDSDLIGHGHEDLVESHYARDVAPGKPQCPAREGVHDAAEHEEIGLAVAIEVAGQHARINVIEIQPLAKGVIGIRYPKNVDDEWGGEIAVWQRQDSDQHPEVCIAVRGRGIGEIEVGPKGPQILHENIIGAPVAVEIARDRTDEIMLGDIMRSVKRLDAAGAADHILRLGRAGKPGARGGPDIKIAVHAVEHDVVEPVAVEVADTEPVAECRAFILRKEHRGRARIANCRGGDSETYGVSCL